MAAQEPALDDTSTNHKHCVQCGELKPLSHFLRRTGRRSGKTSRRGTCRACRKRGGSASEAGLELSGAAFAVSKPSVPMPEYPFAADESPAPVKIRIKRPMPAPPPKPEGPDASVLRLTRSGFIRMRGKTDKGRGWLQETDLETAVTLVREHAAVVVNPHTIRRLYSNKKFRRYILTRDRYTCHFCGEYGDTIDHILPRAKGGHTTPVNCVCACNECNQSKADRSIDEFIGD
ncbi:HNH endonuclease [Paenibacillus contaminans]|uniref:HNH endonuclease n=1 Tax=Paenibacillus contaminans TaxID=450362 RepID=A0A329MHW1_9BACL|nr:HNH endonuclease [Paenibacillus contaminans]